MNQQGGNETLIFFLLSWFPDYFCFNASEIR